jgi:aspartate racemase
MILSPYMSVENQKPIIGILGGLGPRATVAFEGKLLDKLPGTDQELPTIFTINDGSVPDRTKFILGEGEDPVPTLTKNLKLLEQVGVDVICIPCNTSFAPAIINRVKAEATVSFINLPEEVAKEIKRAGLRSVFLLATAGTMRSKIYQDVCSAIDVECIEPSEVIQSLTSQVINDVKSNDMSRANTVAAEIKAAVQESGAEGVILGCTELPLVLTALVPEGCQALDTIDILANAAINFVSQTANK